MKQLTQPPLPRKGEDRNALLAGEKLPGECRLACQLGVVNPVERVAVPPAKRQ